MSRAPLGLEKNIKKCQLPRGKEISGDFLLSIVWQNDRKEKIILRLGCSFQRLVVHIGSEIFKIAPRPWFRDSSVEDVLLVLEEILALTGMYKSPVNK